MICQPNRVCTGALISPFALSAKAAGDYLGRYGDGIDDVIVGACGAKPNGMVSYTARLTSSTS